MLYIVTWYFINNCYIPDIRKQEDYFSFMALQWTTTRCCTTVLVDRPIYLFIQNNKFLKIPSTITLLICNCYFPHYAYSV